MAAVRGYKCIFVLTEKVSVEKMRYLKGLGADIVVCPAAAKHGTPDHYVATAKRIARGDAEFFLSRPIQSPGKSAGPLPNDRARDLGRYRRQDHAFCLGHRHRRDDQRDGPLFEGNEPERQDHRGRPVRFDLQDLQGIGPCA